MKISELGIKDRVKNAGLNKGVSLQALPGDEKSTYGDIRDLASSNRIGSYKAIRQASSSPAINQPTSRTQSINPWTHKNFPNGLEPKQILLSFLERLKQESENPGTRGINNNTLYQFFISPTAHGPQAGITTDANNIDVKFALNTAVNLPTACRIKIPTGTDQEDTKTKSQSLIDGLRQLGYDPQIPQSKELVIQIPPGARGNTNELLKFFWTIVDNVEEMGPDFTRRRSSGGPSRTQRSVTRKATPFRYYLGVATLIYVGTRFGIPNILPRGGGSKPKTTFDINDNLIAQGYSEGAAELMKVGRGEWSKENQQGVWREHAVPCDLIINKGVEMVKQNKSGILIDQNLIMKIAEMIRRNLIIVWVTIPEREKMDFELGLQTTMPQGDGWDPFSDDPLSRLRAADIKVYDAASGARLMENKK